MLSKDQQKTLEVMEYVARQLKLADLSQPEKKNWAYRPHTVTIAPNEGATFIRYDDGSFLFHPGGRGKESFVIEPDVSEGGVLKRKGSCILPEQKDLPQIKADVLAFLEKVVPKPKL